MKWLGKSILALLSLLVLTAIILWVLAKNINPETIKQLVSNQITNLTHKKSLIEGSIHWQLFPRPGLKFSKIKIGDEALNEDYSLAIDNMLLNLKVTPLLHGTFVFNEVTINGLTTQINLNASPEIKSPEQSSVTPTNRTENEKQLAIERLLVNHGQVIINKNGRSTVFKNLQIGIEQFNLKNMPFTVQIKSKLNEYASNPRVKANVNFKGRLSLSPTLLSQLQKGISQSSVEGQLLLQNVLLNQLAIKKISTTIKTNKEGIQFNPLTFSLYNGESIGNMNYASTTQQFSLNQTATNLNGKQLMAVLLGNDMISGTLDYSIHAIIPLAELNLEHSTGTGTITIKEGEIHHLSLQQLLISLKEKLGNLTKDALLNLNKSIPLISWDKSKYTQGNTAFKLASIQYQFQQGILHSDSILLQADALQIRGKGDVNLANQEINSRLQASLNSNNAEPILQKIQQILGGYVPLVVYGTLEHPEVSPDFKMINPFLGQLLEITLNKPLNQIKNRLKRADPLTDKQLHKQFSNPLLAWFDLYGRKDLPWQLPRSPYRVWVSEIMLQQTQVQTVIPYFNRFIQRFPSVNDLAQASEDEVLSHWSGLGYYSRARNLHRTAKTIKRTIRGLFPTDLQSLIDLPGIGPSTAAAILSQAFNLPTAILDGNVKRVLSRFFLIKGWPEQAQVKKTLWDLAQSCMPRQRCLTTPKRLWT